MEVKGGVVLVEEKEETGEERKSTVLVNGIL